MKFMKSFVSIFFAIFSLILISCAYAGVFRIYQAGLTKVENATTAATVKDDFISNDLCKPVSVTNSLSIFKRVILIAL